MFRGIERSKKIIVEAPGSMVELMPPSKSLCSSEGSILVQTHSFSSVDASASASESESASARLLVGSDAAEKAKVGEREREKADGTGWCGHV